MDLNKMMNEGRNCVGKFSYSMFGSRTGTDGTADCSGFVYRCVQAGGGKGYPFVPSTETLHDYLKKNGFALISENREWNMRAGDIVIWGKKGQSAGAGGHTGICLDGQNWVECTAYRNLGVTIQNHDARWAMNGGPYFYVYRLSGESKPTPTPIKPKSHDEAVRDSKPKHQGKSYGKLDFYNGFKKDEIRVSGWLVPDKPQGAIGKYAYVLFMEHGKNKELTRVQSQGIKRPDVKKAYGYQGGQELGFDVTVNTKQFKGKKVDVILRRANSSNGENAVNDVRIDDIYLSF